MWAIKGEATALSARSSTAYAKRSASEPLQPLHSESMAPPSSAQCLQPQRSRRSQSAFEDTPKAAAMCLSELTPLAASLLQV